MTWLPPPLDDTPRPVPAIGLCPCFPGLCRGGDVVAGKLANGTLCRVCIPASQRPAEAPGALLHRAVCHPFTNTP